MLLGLGFVSRLALSVAAFLGVAFGASCGGRAERVTSLDVRCESEPGGRIASEPGEIAAGTELDEVSLQLDNGVWVATWRLGGDHTDVAERSEPSGWQIALLAPDEQGAYAIEVRQDEPGIRGSVSGAGPSFESADRDAVAAIANGKTVTARLPLEAMAEVEVDWGWNAQSYSGNPIFGGSHTDECFTDSTTEPLNASGTVNPPG